MIRAANLASWSGRYWVACLAKSRSAFSRVLRSTQDGRRCTKARITSTWPSPINPWRCAFAVAVSSGGSGSPVSARRWPRSAASATRRLASLRVMRNRSASVNPSLPPSSSSVDCSPI
ncbi:Uncharacterised protein [Mycobacterium tuberculosis]|uniref:Uncharacterized protein n=1 Tax=Mycobacterium tuberculosis TaxID=1773 RepID=A0A0T7LMI2_MYCTX|nr:Uncharacterised protein [Mycobacterium tuberculosis]CFE46609.1 Uncharacterised protein [Mycobacterium tuberculosis]CNL29667.1 Uncharacterised protein [Mycobacterium tuberculosis]CNL91283.1 Uncharacterised protein [Mycobacterium tuberculosis]CNM07079.1 Uncharacterised protein [Mycobacterium tuberculosis]